ncbi:MAG TPA: TonB family protein [Acidobacteriaceae bacterium]|jgi:protein TonB|nr:TonB family protein [Acidobacteriaceae bacterium]
METQISTRALDITHGDHRLGGGFAGSVLFHIALAALLLGWAWLLHSGQNWGEAGASSGAIQATMVADVPLPPKQPMDPNNVLATDSPSPAPITSKAKAVEVPQPDAIAIPTKSVKPLKTADQATPAPPLHPQPTQVNPNQVQTGEATGLNVAMSATQTKAGTVSVSTDAAFGTRYAYYIEQIKMKVAEQWNTNMLDPQAAGHRVYITFQVDRDGSVTNPRIAQRSGDLALDLTALKAVRNIETFGPLPDGYTGSHLNVTYYFDTLPRQ